MCLDQKKKNKNQNQFAQKFEHIALFEKKNKYSRKFTEQIIFMTLLINLIEIKFYRYNENLV